MKSQNKTIQNFSKGFGLIEIIVGSTIITLFLLAIIPLFQNYLNISDKNRKIIQADFLLEEGIEASKILRDNGWTNNIQTLNNGVDYFFYFNGNSWQTATSSNYIDSFFYRTLNINDVYRDGNDNIAPTGVIDLNTKKITINVSWLGNKGTTTKTISTYITNLFDN